MNILHVIDPSAPGGGACTLKLMAEPIARLDDARHDVVVIGTRAHADLARRCGVPVTGAIAPPLGHPLYAIPTLRRVVRERERARGRYDVVHSWTPGAAALAATAAPGRRHAATLMMGPVHDARASWTARILRRRRVRLIATTPGAAAGWSQLGLGGRTFLGVAPGVNGAAGPGGPNGGGPKAGGRMALRKKWGVADDTFVVGLVAEPASWADTRGALDVIIRLAAAERDVRLVLYHGAARRAMVERWAATAGYRGLMVVTDEAAEPWRIAPGLDAALVLGHDFGARRGIGGMTRWVSGGDACPRPAPGVMPLLWLMSAGLPVVAEASGATQDIADGAAAEGERAALMIDRGDINGAAEHMLKLLDDRSHARRVGTCGRARVRDRFDAAGFAARLANVYRNW